MQVRIMVRSISRVLAVLCAAALIASCSTVRLSYDHADWLLARMAGQYVDLDKDQSRLLKAQIGDFHAWHRSQELPRYAALFDDAASRLERGLQPGDVDWVMVAVRERGAVLGRQAGDDFAPVLARLNERQLRQLQGRFEEDNRKFIKTQLAGDGADQVRRRSNWLCDQFEDFLGSLTPAQRARITTLVQGFPDLPRVRLEERKRRQATLVNLLQEHRGTAQLEPALARFLADPDAQRSEANRQAMQRWEQAFAATLVELDHTLSPAQRRNAVARFRAYAADFHELSRETGEAAARTASAQ